ALAMLALDEVADVLNDVRGYIHDQILGAGHVPDSREQEALAEAVTAIEMYLETLDNGSGDPRPMLDTARLCLEQLTPAPASGETEADTVTGSTTVIAGEGPGGDDATVILTRPEAEWAPATTG